MKKIVAVAVLAMTYAFWPALAAAQPAAASPVDASYQGLPYLDGGVGEEERAQLLARENDFNLKLVFAEKSGAYLADVELAVVDAKGQTVLEIKSAGPIVLAQLPAGSYRVKALSNGQMEQKSAAISGRGRSALIFRW
ncbi:MAG: hypothetical protein A2045_01410 [Rhodocyclales bacterium GWA2_65_20]|nr:MAG: hypothetical protein A2045_01410 [Rhodocyclales bacterium GWA2_65_20]